MTVRDLFNVASEVVGYGPEHLRLFCAGQELKDGSQTLTLTLTLIGQELKDGSQTLEALNVVDMGVVGMFFKPRRMLEENQQIKTDIVLPSLVLARSEENFAKLFEALEVPGHEEQAEEVRMLLMRLLNPNSNPNPNGRYGCF